MESKYDGVMERLGASRLPDFVPVTEDAIKQLETQLGYVLPADYRVFVAHYGLTRRRSYTLYPEYGNPSKAGGSVGVFFGLNPQSLRDLLRTRKGLGTRLPKEMLPIAESPGGLICISLAGKDTGIVYWWDRAEDSRSPRRNLAKIADTFDSFIHSLYIGEP